MSDYTPTTEEVRRDYVAGNTDNINASDEELKAEFDRMIAEVKAQAIRDWLDIIEAGINSDGDEEDYEDFKRWRDSSEYYINTRILNKENTK